MYKFKRRITIEQLNQLSDKAKEKLNYYWNPETYDFIYDIKNNRICIINVDVLKGEFKFKTITDLHNVQLEKENILPLLDIIQIIQFINQFTCLLEDYNLKFNEFSARKCICDDLWNVLKILLRSDDM